MADPKADGESQMIIVGIDPGIGGASCVFDTKAGRPVEVIDLPVRRDGEKTWQLDVPDYCNWLSRVGATRVVIERITPMPGLDAKGARTRSMGAASAFRFGVIFGQLRASVEALGAPLSLVTPVVWKRHWKLPAAKDSAMALVLEKWPDMKAVLFHKIHHNRADATLIAAWGAVHHRGLAAGTV